MTLFGSQNFIPSLGIFIFCSLLIMDKPLYLCTQEFGWWIDKNMIA